MDLTEVTGLTAGIFTASSLVPQIIKTIKEKKAKEISIGMLLVLMLGVALWVVYGIMRHDFPIIITNSFSLLMNITTLYLRFKYNHK
jgi:MtN3 and saliva related transmembrane protein